MNSPLLASCFSSDEIRVIQQALTRIDVSAEEHAIQSLVHGEHWTQRVGKKTANDVLCGQIESCLKHKINKLIGGNQTQVPDYEIARSALLTLIGIPEDEALDLALNCKAFRHPPTGDLLHLYLLTSEQIKIMIHSGLKSLRA